MITHTMGADPSSSLRLVIESAESIKDIYHVEKHSLGKGAFGAVRKATVRATGAVRAVKTISRQQMKEQRKLFKREVEIMKLIDHPNIMMLYDIFEGHKQLYLVLQLCSGGSVSEYIKKAGTLSEVQAAAVMRHVLRAICYLHNNHICHRDVKAENILLVSRGRIERSGVKVAGLSFAHFLKAEQEPFKGSGGTLTHMAPEVLQKKYGLRCDVWSCGVMLYGFIAAHLPFQGNTDAELRAEILKKKPTFAKGMAEASQLVLDFIERLLVKNPAKRCSPQQALADKWVVTVAPKFGQVPLAYGILKKVFNFRRLTNLQRAVLHVLSAMLPEAEIDVAQKFFIHVDSNGDGMISVAELREALGVKTPPPDTGDQSDLTYTEFLAATLDLHKHIDSSLLRDVFSSFDKNADGTLSLSEISTGTEIGAMSMDEVISEIEKVDLDGSGNVDFVEFQQMMRRGLGQQLGEC